MCCKDRDVKSTTIRQSVRPIQRDKTPKDYTIVFTLLLSVQTHDYRTKKIFCVAGDNALSSFFF